MLTLTVPHEATDSVSERIERARSAWCFFVRYLNEHLRSIDAHRSARWYRAIEWTEGSDGKGHPHFHLWVFSPYLHQQDLLVPMWRRALAATGLAAQAVIVDVQEIDDGPSAALEVIKYLVKDLAAGGGKVTPEVFAQVYEAFDGKRMTQASSGFLALAPKGRQACECGSLLPRRVRVAQRQDAIRKEKPNDLAE